MRSVNGTPQTRGKIFVRQFSPDGGLQIGIRVFNSPLDRHQILMQTVRLSDSAVRGWTRPFPIRVVHRHTHSSTHPRSGHLDRKDQLSSSKSAITDSRVQSHCHARRWQAGYGYPKSLYPERIDLTGKNKGWQATTATNVLALYLCKTPAAFLGPVRP
jgi:hypothetical protein